MNLSAFDRIIAANYTLEEQRRLRRIAHEAWLKYLQANRRAVEAWLRETWRGV